MPARIYTLPLEAPQANDEATQPAGEAPEDAQAGVVVFLQPHQQDQRLADAIESLTTRLAATEVPSPETFGWVAVEHVDGRAVQWLQPEYEALIGYVPGAPDMVYLDRNNHCCSWSMTLEELALGLEFGTLPDPAYEVSLP